MVRKYKIKKVVGVLISPIVVRVCRIDHVFMCFYSLYHSGSFDLLDKDHDGLSLGGGGGTLLSVPFLFVTSGISQSSWLGWGG